jgi:hypothetical protein
MSLPRVVRSDQVFKVLAETGLFDNTSGDLVSRVVIDLKATDVPVIHVEFIGDERLLKVTKTLEGIEISRE